MISALLKSHFTAKQTHKGSQQHQTLKEPALHGTDIQLVNTNYNTQKSPAQPTATTVTIPEINPSVEKMIKLKIKFNF